MKPQERERERERENDYKALEKIDLNLIQEYNEKVISRIKYRFFNPNSPGWLSKKSLKISEECLLDWASTVIYLSMF